MLNYKVMHTLLILCIALFTSKSVAVGNYETISGVRPAPESQSNRFIKINESLFAKNQLHNGKTIDVFKVDVSGYVLVLDADSSEGFNLYEKLVGNRDNPRMNLGELSISADKLIVRGSVRFPQTNVRIVASNIHFEDSAASHSFLSTRPIPFDARAEDASITDTNGADGQEGMEAGSILIAASTVSSNRPTSGAVKRFLAVGGSGQKPGEGRKPEKGKSVPPLDCNNVGFQFSCNCFTRKGINYKNVVFMENRKIPRSWGLNRFPEDGSPGIPAGKPGTGGRGGEVVISNGAYEALIDVSGGPSGERGSDSEGGDPGTPNPAYKTCMNGCNPIICSSKTTKSGASGIAPNAEKPSGENGTIKLNNKLGWTNQLNVEATMSFAKGMFRSGNNSSTKSILEKLQASIISSRNNKQEYAEDRSEHAQSVMLQIDKYLHLITKDRDYYGNTKEWAPTLSLEVLLLIYKSDIRNALRTLSLYQQITDRQLSAKSERQAVDVAFRYVVTELSTLRAKIIELSEELPALLRKSSELSSDIESYEELVKLEEASLLERADYIAKQQRNELDKVTSLLEIGRSVAIGAQGIGGLGLQASVLEIAANLSDLDESSKWTNTERTIGSINKLLGAIEGGKESYSQLSTSKSSDISKIYAELRSNSKHYKNLIDKLETLVEDLESAKDSITSIKSDYAESRVSLSKKLQQAMVLSGKSISSSRYLNSELTSVANALRQEQLERLTKYQHYMVRAFEYEFLTPYRLGFNLENTVAEIVHTLNSSPNGVYVDLTDSQLDAISAVFRRDLEEIVSRGISNLGVAGGRVASFVEIGLNNAELETLNSRQPIEIDLEAKGLLFDDEFNRRLKNVTVSKISLKDSVSSRNYGVLKIVASHPGVSTISTRSRRYRFSHGGENVSPFLWEYSFSLSKLSESVGETGAINTDRSLISSFIYTLGDVPYSTADIRAYSLPGLVAPYRILVKHSGLEPVVLSDLVLQLEYEYQP